MSELNQKATMSEREFCETVGISRITAWRLRERNELPHCRVGNRVLYLPRHIDEFLAAHEQPTKDLRRNRRVEK
jgi:predicted DNA-binding transcriptional regulator AlpA